MNMKHLGGGCDCEEGITQLQVQKPVTVPFFFLPQIPHRLTWGFSSGLRGEKPAINRLSCGSARFDCVIQNNVPYFDIITFILPYINVLAETNVSHLARQT